MVPGVGRPLASAAATATPERLLDAADALGLAISHAHAGASFAAIGRSTTLAPRAHAQYRKGRSY